ncbi:Dps family protein [Nocardia pseudovaccinii]|uniref:Dps family protein n=1 Tax=Nocardia pseudovaccinii TaxID=189540 RepID=UPI0007A4B22B|nr:DNA starvation/stationary phase protection protein [Nocardia pseudovaccinii]
MSTTSIVPTSAFAASGFRASPRLRANLQQVLADLVALHLLGKQAHSNVVGHNFRDLHLPLDEVVDFIELQVQVAQVVDTAREGSDIIAERMRALDAMPDGRPETVAAMTQLKAFPPGEQNTVGVVGLICDRLCTTAGTMRAVHDAVDAEDPSTADLLHALIDDIEKQRWMLSAEKRTAHQTR